MQITSHALGYEGKVQQKWRHKRALLNKSIGHSLDFFDDIADGDNEDRSH